MVKISKVTQQKVSIQGLERESAYYQEKFSSLKNLLDFYTAIFIAQLNVLSEIKKVSPPIDQKELKNRLEEGLPATERTSLMIDSKEFMKSLEKICETVSEKISGKKKLKTGLKNLLGSKKLKSLNLAKLIANLQKGDASELADLSDEVSLKPETLSFLLYNAIVPFYKEAALDILANLDISQWKNGFCPICGSRPNIARCRLEDGLKVLQCSLCRTQWGHQRLKCVFCGNDDPKTLHYFFNEDDKGHRVEVCEKCKKYLKISDERVFNREVIPEVEDVATFPLDVVAEKKDYSPIIMIAKDLN